MTDDSTATRSSDRDATFCLSGTSTGFESRAASIFSALESPDDKPRDKYSVNTLDSSLMLPPPRCSKDDRRRNFSPKSQSKGGEKRDRRSIADHVVHPERWKKYSLEDTDLSSESQNKQAAFAFLAELKGRKSGGDKMSEVADFHPKFKKPKRKETGGEEIAMRKYGSVVTLSGKQIQKEYVIGERSKEGRQTRKVVGRGKVGKGRSLVLSHLEEEEDEGEAGD